MSSSPNKIDHPSIVAVAASPPPPTLLFSASPSFQENEHGISFEGNLTPNSNNSSMAQSPDDGSDASNSKTKKGILKKTPPQSPKHPSPHRVNFSQELVHFPDDENSNHLTPINVHSHARVQKQALKQHLALNLAHSNQNEDPHGTQKEMSPNKKVSFDERNLTENLKVQQEILQHMQEDENMIVEPKTPFINYVSEESFSGSSGNSSESDDNSFSEKKKLKDVDLSKQPRSPSLINEEMKKKRKKKKKFRVGIKFNQKEDVIYFVQDETRSPPGEYEAAKPNLNEQFKLFEQAFQKRFFSSPPDNNSQQAATQEQIQQLQLQNSVILGQQQQQDRSQSPILTTTSTTSENLNQNGPKKVFVGEKVSFSTPERQKIVGYEGESEEEEEEMEDEEEEEENEIQRKVREQKFLEMRKAHYNEYLVLKKLKEQGKFDITEDPEEEQQQNDQSPENISTGSASSSQYMSNSEEEDEEEKYREKLIKETEFESKRKLHYGTEYLMVKQLREEGKLRIDEEEEEADEQATEDNTNEDSMMSENSSNSSLASTPAAASSLNTTNMNEISTINDNSQLNASNLNLNEAENENEEQDVEMRDKEYEGGED